MKQSIHQQLFKRMHDLEYLQWMQKNSLRYMAGICVLTVLLSASVLWQQSMIKQDSPDSTVAQQAAVKEPISAAMQPVAFEKATQISGQPQQIQAEQVEPKLYHTDKDASVQQPAEKENHEEAFNPLHLPGYQAPCSGMLQYNYGLGYDPVYEDYRFHRELCYAAGDGSVLACADGRIVQVQMEQYWQLAIEAQGGTVWYRGLHTCHLTEGDTVQAGEQLGTAEDKLYIRATKNQ